MAQEAQLYLLPEDEQTQPSKSGPRDTEQVDRLVQLTPDQCMVSGQNGRDYTALTFEACQTLINSIGLVGVIEPIVVRMIASGRYEVICGSRRLFAVAWLRQHGQPELTLPAIVREGDDLRVFELSDFENRARSDLSAIERGRAYKAALATHYKGKQAALVKALDLREATVSNLLALASWSRSVLAAYPSPHAILEVDAQRLAPGLRRNSEAVQREAAVIAKEQERLRSEGAAPIDRATVTARLVRAARGADARRPLCVTNAKGELLLSLRGRSGEGITVLVHGTSDSDPVDLGAALQHLVEEYRSGRSHGILTLDAKGV